MIWQVSGYPNPLPKGETFTVSLPKAADSRTMIVVTDMSGRQVYRNKVAQGVVKTEIDPYGISEGMLVYTVIYGDGEVVSDKLIIE